MTDSLDQARQKVAEIRESLEITRFAVELYQDNGDPGHAQAKARALEELKKTVDSVELLAANLGGVPAPACH